MRGIAVGNDDISVEVEGTNEVVDRVVVLTKIHANYTLRVLAETPRDKIDRALDTHVGKCPTAQSIKNSVDITWSAEITER